ncbi:MAG: protein translocase subunit SecF [Coriobacteriia bacterium]|nr:protein translocase subunit SecF [Coriobacteriia bacterium]
MRRFNIDFLGNKQYLFILSGVLLAISLGALVFRGLSFGIEFEGGTVVELLGTGNIGIEQVRDAFHAADVKGADVQSFSGDTNGFIVRTDIKEVAEAQQVAGKVASGLDLPANSIQVTTIGPGWGKNVTERSLIALAVSFGAILLYVALRFEYKMSVAAIITLMHDVTITLGFYALFGEEITPNTVAALLTILGYSLYDTIVMFHRIKENSAKLSKKTFASMANDSVNEVLVRTVNTIILSLIPVITLLVFGGDTLYDFALALTIGLAVSSFSSFGIATPIYVMWKEREPKYAALKKKYAKQG